MSFSTIIVTGRYESLAGPASGTVTFTRSATLRDSITGEVILPTPMVAHLDALGVLRAPLVANDDPTTTPTDSTYLVQEAAGDCTRTYTITVPYDAPNGLLDLVTVASGLITGSVQLYAVTGSGGAGIALATPNVWTAPQTFTAEAGGTPLLIFPTPTDATGISSALVLAPNLPAGGAAAGFGTAVNLQLPSDAESYYTVGRMIAYWLDAADATAASAIRFQVTAAGGTLDRAALTLRPEGMEIPLIAAPAGNPPVGMVWLYVDSADSHVKKKLDDGTVVDLG